MDDVEVVKIKMAVSLPWWIQPIVYGGLVACMYTYPYYSTIGVGIVASILWYFCFRFYNQLVAVYNKQSLLNLIESLSGTLSENGGLKESEAANKIERQEERIAELEADCTGLQDNLRKAVAAWSTALGNNDDYDGDLYSELYEIAYPEKKDSEVK